MIVRNKIIPWFVKPENDPCWSLADWGRAATIEAKWTSIGVSEDERRRLVPCYVWMKKFPGTRFSEDIMVRLQTLS